MYNWQNIKYFEDSVGHKIHPRLFFGLLDLLEYKAYSVNAQLPYISRLDDHRRYNEYN